MVGRVAAAWGLALILLQLCLPAAAAGRTDQLTGEASSTASSSTRIGPGPRAGAVCRLFGMAALPVLGPLSLGYFEPGKWAGDRRQCYTMLAHGGMAVGAFVVNGVGHPRRPAVFGAGQFDEFFRDALRSRSRTNNFFASGPGALWAPIFASGALLLTAPMVAGKDGYQDSLSRAMPLLWLGLAGNALPTGIAKKSFGRRRPFLEFRNERASRAFGVDDDARESFYSGHASTAFFSAAFVDPVMADLVRSRWPAYSIVGSAPASMRLLRLTQAFAFYGLAAVVSYSRIDIDKHFMTDLIAGGVVGTLHGRLTYHLGYAGYEKATRVSVSTMEGGKGIRISWVF